MPSVRSRSLLLAALLMTGLAAAISCSLAGLTDPPPTSSSTAGSGASDAGAMDAKLVYEAEDAQIVGKYVIRSDPDASSGRYVIVPDDAGACNNYDYVLFNVSVSADGAYLIWTRALGPGLHNDTFYVQTDMGPPYMVRTSVLGQWVEDAVFDANGEVKAPIHYQWDAGPHQIIVECRAGNVSLDRIRLEALGP